MPRTFSTSLVVGGIALAGLILATTSQAVEPTRLHLELKDGTVVIKLRPDLAPNHVARIRELVETGFYDGLKFHRVIDGFMAQTGDPHGNGTGGSGQVLAAEFSDHPHVRGTVSMARASDPDSADSQFFIVFDDARFLDGQYTVWGEVEAGMEFVDSIKRGSGPNGMVADPDAIVRMYFPEG